MTLTGDRVDFVVVGGGPAGMSAALLASQNGVDTRLLERSDRLGGQIRWADAPVPDLLGAYAEEGNALADRFVAHLESSPAQIQTHTDVHTVHREADRLRLTLASGAELTARRILLATGLSHRRLGVPGEELTDRIANPRQIAESLRGQTLTIVGGGDEACSLARDLAEHAARVALLVRGTPRARALFADAARQHPRVTLTQGAIVCRFERDGKSDGVVSTLTSGETLRSDAVFIRIGVEPALPNVEPALERLPDGRLRVDAFLRTSDERLFAAGDLIRPLGQHYIAAALADGAVAARRIEEDLTSSRPTTP